MSVIPHSQTGLPAAKLVEMIWIIPKVLGRLLPAQCMRASVWCQSALVEGLERGNTYGSFGKLKQLVALSLQLDCLLTNSSTPTLPLFCYPLRHPCMCSLNQSVQLNSEMDWLLDPLISAMIQYCRSLGGLRVQESHSHVLGFCFFVRLLTAPTLADLKLWLTCWTVMAPSCVSAG